jgi:threonine dehydratase
MSMHESEMGKPSEIAGIYLKQGAGASGLQLTLHPNGNVVLRKWLDLGGSWRILGEGKFFLVGNVIHTTLRDLDFAPESLSKDGILHIRQVAGEKGNNVILSPSESIEKLDEAIDSRAPELSRLHDTVIGLSFFFKEEPSYAATVIDSEAAALRIAGMAHRTPVMTCATLDGLAGRALFLKCENLQKVGAFKFRGACNAVQKLSEEEAKRGVVTHSSGNHAQALALAAKLRGIPAHIVMPRTAPPVKRRGVEGYGGRVIDCEPTLAARETTVARVQAETGAILIHPYNHPDVIAGQGTVALELLQQVSNLDAIVAPVGGGGLVSGIALAAKALNPKIRVFAAEPKGADDAARSKQAGKLIPQTAPNTVADGLLTSLGELTWPVVRDLVESVVTVADADIIAAMRLLWERAKLVVEPSGAVPLAAVLSDEFRNFAAIRRVGIVLSGGNVNLDNLAGLFAAK